MHGNSENDLRVILVTLIT